MEKNIKIDVQTILPGVETTEDPCIERLESALQNQHQMKKVHLEQADGSVQLCLHYDPDCVTDGEVKHLAERAGASIINRYHHEVIPLEGLDCSDCALVIEHSLLRMEGVLSVQVNYASQKCWIEYDTHLVSRWNIDQRIHSLGYSIQVGGKRKWLLENRELLSSLLAGLFLLGGWAGTQFGIFPRPLSLGLFLATYLAGGWDITRHAVHALRERHFDTDALMLIAALGAATLGNFTEGGLLIFLFSLGHALEERALDRARSAVEALADLTPKTALVRRDGVEVELPVNQLLLKESIIVRPGARIPADGLIFAGSSAVDQSTVTGESIPLDKSVGDPVYAGTVNGEGSLEIQVTRLTADNTLNRVMKMVEEAQTRKSPTQQLMERFERIFVPAVLGMTLLVIAIPPLFGVPFRDSFMRAMTLLVAASPCALALGAPATILAGVAQAARNGVLIKGGVHLENLGALKAIAFDKTGTITNGSPEVTNVVVFSPETWTEDQILALAAALESRSSHPLARSIVKAAKKRGIVPICPENVESLTGLGIRSVVDHRSVMVGSLKMLAEMKITIPPEISAQAAEFERNGMTVVVIVVEGAIVGMITLADTLRPDAVAMLIRLRKLGIQKTALLTGDNPQVAAEIAKQAGLSDYFAGLLPEDKSDAVRAYVERYGAVGMVGDGVNDAPALASATVGIAMGAAGTDVALETADVALMADNLNQLPFAIGLGRATSRIIRQNLIIALAVIGCLIIATLTGWVGMGGAVVLHEGSTLLVILNSLRLLGFRG